MQRKGFQLPFVVLDESFGAFIMAEGCGLQKPQNDVIGKVEDEGVLGCCFDVRFECSDILFLFSLVFKSSTEDDPLPLVLSDLLDLIICIIAGLPDGKKRNASVGMQLYSPIIFQKLFQTFLLL